MGLCPKPRDFTLSRQDSWTGRRAALALPESRPLSRRSGCVSAEPYPPLRSVKSTRDESTAVYTIYLTRPNTDLDLHLKKHGIHKLIVMGLIAHTCVEATVRYGAELGYEVTVVKDATASYSDEHMHAALEVNLPNYASAIVTTDEIVATLASLAGVEVPARALTGD